MERSLGEGEGVRSAAEAGETQAWSRDSRNGVSVPTEDNQETAPLIYYNDRN